MSRSRPIETVPLRKGRLWLEPIGDEHVEAFSEAVNASESSIRRWLSPAYAPRTPEDVALFVREWKEGWARGLKYGLVAREENEGRVVGFGLLNQINPSHRFANLGYWIRPEAEGQGYATSITVLLAAFAFDTLDLVRVELVVEVENLASQRVAEKAGGVLEGRLRDRLVVDGEARDGLIYSLVRSEL